MQVSKLENSSVTIRFTYKDVHEHVQRQPVLLRSPAVPCSDLLAVLLNKPHDLLHVFGNVPHLILLRAQTFQHGRSIKETFLRQ